MRKIYAANAGDNIEVRIYRNHEWDEYVVRFYMDGLHVRSADYHTYDEQDAMETADFWIRLAAQIKTI